jgi:hypothetical protein
MIAERDFNVLCLAWIAVAVVLFPVLLKVRQPYGKHVSDKWGPMISNTTGWFIMELPALLVFCYFLSRNFNPANLMVLAAGSLWCLHYIHRAVIFPFLLRTRGKKMPLLIVSFAVLFNTVNGFLNGYWLSHFAENAGPESGNELRILTGVILFLGGFSVNKYHDTVLINLRKATSGGYQVPVRGLFRYVSCPNYLGEIIAWTGFYLVTYSLPALSFLVWTFVNLVPRALDHHKWYRREFPGYPSDRKAIFPFLM